jgi:GT2 family glycosyltransferase
MGDLEFTRRCFEKGFNICYGENVIIYHPARSSLGKFFKRRFRVTCWKEVHLDREYGNRTAYDKFRSVFIKFIMGFKKVLKRKASTGKITDTAKLKLLSLSILFFDLFARLQVLFGFKKPQQIRE